MVKPQPLRADVAEVLEHWQPKGWSYADRRKLQPLLGIVRDWVAAATPANGQRAGHMLAVTGEMVIWAQQALGTTDARTVLHPDNVEYFSMVVNKHRPVTWRESTRGVLRTVGRSANPHWPPPPRTVGRRPLAAPYTQHEETKWVRAARLVGHVNRACRMWIVGGSLGAGLKGTELAAAGTEDVVEIANGGIAVQVRGSQPRLVPIRETYTDLVWESIGAIPGGRFIPATNRNAVHRIVDLLTPLNGKRLLASPGTVHLAARSYRGGHIP